MTFGGSGRTAITGSRWTPSGTIDLAGLWGDGTTDFDPMLSAC